MIVLRRSRSFTMHGLPVTRPRTSKPVDITRSFAVPQPCTADSLQHTAIVVCCKHNADARQSLCWSYRVSLGPAAIFNVTVIAIAITEAGTALSFSASSENTILSGRTRAAHALFRITDGIPAPDAASFRPSWRPHRSSSGIAWEPKPDPEMRTKQVFHTIWAEYHLSCISRQHREFSMTLDTTANLAVSAALCLHW